MSEFEVWVPVEIDRPGEVVWDALTSAEMYIKWWWGTDELMEVDPDFEVGATLRFVVAFFRVTFFFAATLRFGAALRFTATFLLVVVFFLVAFFFAAIP